MIIFTKVLNRIKISNRHVRYLNSNINENNNIPTLRPKLRVIDILNSSDITGAAHNINNLYVPHNASISEAISHLITYNLSSAIVIKDSFAQNGI
jgi:hypothetical protein